MKTTTMPPSRGTTSTIAPINSADAFFDDTGTEIAGS